MNFSSLFRGLSNFQLPYSIESTPYHETAQWQLFEARSKKPETLDKHVTVFRPKEGADRRFILNDLRCAKRIRFPGLCNVLDVMDGSNGTTIDEQTVVLDSLLIVTEYVKPVDGELSLSSEAMYMGIWDLCQAVGLLESKFFIGNLSDRSIFYNESGEWVIFGLECCMLAEDARQQPDQYIAEVQRFTGNRIKGTLEKWDMMCLGETLETLLPKVGSIPIELKSIINKQRINGQLNVSNFLKTLQNTKVWKEAKQIVESYGHLKELHIANDKEKMETLIQFNITIRDHITGMKDSRKWLQSFTPGLLDRLIVPELCSTITWMSTQQAIYQGNIVISLALLLEYIIATKCRTVEIDTLLWGMWRLADREIRCLLLMHCHGFLKDVTNDSFQFSDKVFPYFLQGLIDSEESLRLLTLRNIPYIVELLTERQLNNELLRSIAKTQVDPSVKVRTETLLVVSRIAPQLKALSNRDSVLATIFTKSLKDPESETRLAALYGLEQCLPLFGSDVIANKIMSVIAPGLLDSDSGIRTAARTLFDKYLKTLETAAIEKFGNVKSETDQIEPTLKKFGRTQEIEMKEMDDMCIGFLRGLHVSVPTTTDIHRPTLREMSPATTATNIMAPPSERLAMPVVSMRSAKQAKQTTPVTVRPATTNDVNDGWDDDGDNGWDDFNDIASDTDKTKLPATNASDDDDDDDDGWDAADW
ncbi:similar to Saccharomyces cerevisiae YOR112W CEX1 Cytoplasmic component of the nuclear aminoacylation-dependent tRNA export pathway [Maudiozyma barnettii]|uniref:Similar to Saccharomyces cerevisiae YOR112W CEX1 Cytoplasmic component of the nuclear aminoacylation-dependent tRNA export pathway n=1 Tax=Maudiozyma barnettii TaxID=61262 RepID=A0A8H2VEP9_9SACH|nr:Cex1p [Kazachstania barnettii]CAB4254216.1 similar to Saccharomyces cerevisiae YOR112W CEX1 Cytoplasmic component of the nuclear aminoacylation-dependent tRNA export pathway [Kazachstania barnettii]CAD1781950.1 similar to Saccharomyces cerevisiae YOR112W CEX1 Cytoplasmic component of the nuclear aminoacylation-dependent tRNA export pathway [Kazachstania barnettii]